LAFQNTHSSVLLGKTTHGQSRPAKIIDALESPARISFENDPETAAPTLLALADADQMSLAPVVMITGDLPGNTVGPLENLGNDDQTRYIVRDGDTLADIAEIFDISVSTIKNANEKETKSKIKTGMELVIPPMDGLPYTILKGDTFGGVAKKFNIDADDIADFNYILDRTSLVAGTTIFIPNGKPLPEIKAAPTRSSSSSSNKGVGLSFSGSLGKPVNGPITSGYGMRSGGMHKGMDFGAPIGTPVYAAGSGYVKKASAGYNGGFGTMVVIGHSSYDTLYAHMSRTTTTTGAYVAKGQVIGYSGNTGRSTGPHLHFEVRVGGKPVNPTSYLR
jgi:murein DD-endopeptidase MepM/ murein hydrolase activator NlpD